MNQHLEQFKTDGYFVVKDAITPEQATQFRELSDNYFDNYPVSPFMDGLTVPGWAGATPELEELNSFHEDTSMLEIAGAALGCDDFIYTDHSDLHRNIVTLWHRDHFDFGLGAPGAESFQGFSEENFWGDRDQLTPPALESEGFPDGFWSDEHKVIKVCFLLQDHKDNDLGLWMMAGSHKAGVRGEERCLRSSPTDLIVFDHRIMHRGQVQARQYHKLYPQGRVLLAWGYGVDNQYTRQFMAGCNERQQFGRKGMRLVSA